MRLLLVLFLLGINTFTNADELPRADGYHGIWYSNQPSKDEFVYKYSGGLGTYCAKHIPFAIYAHEVNKTFFVFGGSKGVGEEKPLLEMISYYDHNTGMVPKPVIVREKGTGDAHHNPTLSIDENGYLWIFMSAHGGKDGFIYKSKKPYEIAEFDLIMQREFTYPQPWYSDGQGFLFCFTKYTGGREIYTSTSSDGITWSDDQKIIGYGGHYSQTCTRDGKTGITFNWHPPKVGLNGRTDLHYMQTVDGGKTWQTVDGKPINVPLLEPKNAAMIRDYQNEGYLAYLKDINFDADGNPVILHIISKGYESGPDNGPRMWMIAHWLGDEWAFRKVAESDHNYDMGSLYIEGDMWRVIAPTEPGAKPYCTGGDVVVWQSEDQGKTWDRVTQLTHDQNRNHTYVRRPVVAHPDFYALWADGDPLKPSESNLYFTNQAADQVFMLPREMKGEMQKPIVITEE